MRKNFIAVLWLGPLCCLLTMFLIVFITTQMVKESSSNLICVTPTKLELTKENLLPVPTNNIPVVFAQVTGTETKVPTATVVTPTLTPTPLPYTNCAENGQGVICFGDYFKELPETSYTDVKIYPKYIILHWDGRPAGNAQYWTTSSTWYGLAGGHYGGHSCNFAVGLDGVGQFLRMYDKTVIQGKCASEEYDPISINIEMAGREYNDLVTGAADEETSKTMEIISEKTLELVIRLMDQYQIPIENVIGHYQIYPKRDPGDKWLQEYFLPKLKEKLEEREML